jgi:hypothetical protein
LPEFTVQYEFEYVDAQVEYSHHADHHQHHTPDLFRCGAVHSGIAHGREDLKCHPKGIEDGVGASYQPKHQCADEEETDEYRNRQPN